jgi:ribosome maturation factor RimP
LTTSSPSRPTSVRPSKGEAHFGRALEPAELIEEAISEAVEALGFEVVAVDWAGAARHRVVRVYLDRAPKVGEGAQSAVEPADPKKKDRIGLDDITRLSPVVSNALDAAEADPASVALQKLLKSGYTLECSSPGIERPLAKAKHFLRFVGQRVSVRTHEPLEAGSKQRGFHGYVSGHEPDAVHPEDPRGGTVLLEEADGDGVIRIPLSAIKRAHLVYED